MATNIMLSRTKLPLILVFYHLLLRNTFAQTIVVIDTLWDMTDAGDRGQCTQYDLFDDILCKTLPSGGFEGYWTSCELSNCELTITLGKITQDAYPRPFKLTIVSFVGETDAQIIARYRLTPAGSTANLSPRVDPDGAWQTTEINLNPDLPWSPESVLILRLSSGPSAVDVVDKIIIEFAESQTTPQETTPQETTEIPREDIIVDTIEDMGVGWTFNCAYHSSHSELACPTRIPTSSGNRTGFWASCGHYCTLSYSWAKKSKIPTTVIINSFIAGHGGLEIWVRVQGVLKLVGTVRDTTWTNTVFSLDEFGLDENSEILFEPFSTRYPHHVDLIDKITIIF
jgi:hypothetical protein